MYAPVCMYPIHACMHPLHSVTVKGACMVNPTSIHVFVGVFTTICEYRQFEDFSTIA